VRFCPKTKRVQRKPHRCTRARLYITSFETNDYYNIEAKQFIELHIVLSQLPGRSFQLRCTIIIFTTNASENIFCAPIVWIYVFKSYDSRAGRIKTVDNTVHKPPIRLISLSLFPDFPILLSQQFRNTSRWPRDPTLCTGNVFVRLNRPT